MTNWFVVPLIIPLIEIAAPEETDATTGEVDDGIFDDIARTFFLDEKNRAFFREHNVGRWRKWGEDCSRLMSGDCGRPMKRPSGGSGRSTLRSRVTSRRIWGM
jgi:hypothetical protein